MQVEQSIVSALAAGLEYSGKGQQRTAAGPTVQAAEGLSRVGTEGTTMQELRFVAVSEDGRYAVLAIPGRSARFMLPIDERLRAVALGQTSRLAQYELEVASACAGSRDRSWPNVPTWPSRRRPRRSAATETRHRVRGWAR